MQKKSASSAPKHSIDISINIYKYQMPLPKSQNELIYNLYRAFEAKMGKDADIIAFAPGRVNLIGEHIDYNGGHVLPCALTLGTYAAARKRDDAKIRLYSLDFESEGVIEKDLNRLDTKAGYGWQGYVLGVIWAFKKYGYEIPYGFDFVCKGDIPLSAGLSSSASLEVVTGTVIRDLYNIGNREDASELPLIAQMAENDYVGLSCGIMDQFASANGRKDSAILLDCSTLEYKYAPLNLDDYNIVIANTNKKHKLVTSEYNKRREECENALLDLRQALPELKSLCALSAEEFSLYRDLIKDDSSKGRALHAVSEETRTIEAFEALMKSDLKRFGELMYLSHNSLRDNFDVSCEELDFLVDIASKSDGVIGARMTGGGFGGCTVNIVNKNYIGSFIEGVGAAYHKRFGFEASFYTVTAGDGAKVIERR